MGGKKGWEEKERERERMESEREWMATCTSSCRWVSAHSSLVTGREGGGITGRVGMRRGMRVRAWQG
jgi:hypothetical protein